MERAGLSYYKQHGKREAQGEYRCILCALLTQVGYIGGGGERGNLNTFPHLEWIFRRCRSFFFLSELFLCHTSCVRCAVSWLVSPCSSLTSSFHHFQSNLSHFSIQSSILVSHFWFTAFLKSVFKWHSECVSAWATFLTSDLPWRSALISLHSTICQNFSIRFTGVKDLQLLAA